MLDEEEVSHSRAIYNCLDFLGDVGGLFDALRVISQSIIYLATPLSVTNYLASRLFYTNANHKPNIM